VPTPRRATERLFAEDAAQVLLAEHEEGVGQSRRMEPMSLGGLLAYGGNYATVQPVRLDPNNIQTSDLLGNMKAALAGGLPAMFGSPTYVEFDYSTGDISNPSEAINHRIARYICRGLR
jgi:hypothetical protein